ncbi:Gag protease polyprotein-like protein [Abeliophyllum distichum]|uniref:Gag protease polyprotein-like protein n=1 Tax=Abeliophyllum distichum TaxID=126358 RepID=A0ABD1VYF9_9LAMI
MTIVEYQRRFMELSKYATLLIANEADRCKRFEGDLRKDIKVAVICGDYKDFGELVKATLRVEQCILDTPGHKEQMTVRGSGCQSGTWTSRSMSSQKNRRGFWPGVTNTSSFKTKSRGGQSSGSNHGSLQQLAHRHSHAQGSFQSPSQRPVTSTEGGSSRHARFP